MGTTWRRPRQRLVRDSALALAVAVTCGMAAATASAASSHAAAGSGRAGQAGLPAGQTGTRSEVPWKNVGRGWSLAEYTTGKYPKRAPVWLYLVDPQGGKYQLHRWPATVFPWRLISWSGDKTRALFARTSGLQAMDQLNLVTGKVTAFRLPPSVTAVFGYTSPDGENILVGDHGIARYSLTGKFQAQLIKGDYFGAAISAPNGQTEVIDARAGLDLVSNVGGVIRRLHVPGVGGTSGGCTPVRWWKPTVVLAQCGLTTPKKGTQLWLVSVSGTRPTALTAERAAGVGPDFGDLDAWRFPSGLYVQAIGACGSQFIGKQSPGGSVTADNPPGNSGGTNIVVATAGHRLLVREVIDGCFPRSALVWFNPGTHRVTKVLPAPKNGDGVLYVVAYNRNGEQPSGVE